MSLHAQLSSEAQAALQAQKRNSTISAIVISLLVFALIILVLAFLFLASVSKKNKEIVSFAPGVSQEDQIEKPEVTSEVQRKPSAPSSSMSKVIASSVASPTAVPTPDIEVTEASLEFGSGDDIGTGWGNGDGDGDGGGGFGNIPSDMRKRCSKADRLQRLAKEGGKPECEDNVVKSLQWLQKTQASDGSWCDKHKVGMTGLALLAFLGHCETPNSAEFGTTVNKAIVFLIDVGMKNNGRLAQDYNDMHWCYEHAIATYALAEAYTFCNKLNIPIPNLKEVVEKAGNFIIDNQSSSGAWAYFYKGESAGDSSIACWHLQALKACNHTGLKFEKIRRVADKGLDYLETCQREDGGVYYTPGPGHHPTMTGAAMLCYQQWGKGSRSVVRNGAKFVRKNLQFKYDESTGDLYANYYYGQAMINRGGEEWVKYNNMFMDEVLKSQNADGSYKAPGSKGAIPAAGADRFTQNTPYGAHYRTCMNTLMLEVYYRFLPGSSAH